MSGNKNSGRRPYSQEHIRRQTIQLAWERIYRLMAEPTTTKDQLLASKEIVLKSMPSEIKQDLNMQAHIITEQEQDILTKYRVQCRATDLTISQTSSN